MYRFRSQIIGRDDETYESLEQAQEAVRSAMRWPAIALSRTFVAGVADGGEIEGVECYPTQEECDANPDGDPHAPRVLIVPT